MRFLFGMAFAGLVFAQTAHYGHAANGALLPDHKVTPGKADPHVTQANIQQTICKPGYTATVRDVTEATKKAVYAEYGANEKSGVCCEVDHLLSLELAGTNDIANLWPEPYLPKPGARDKDQIEDFLHRQVCSGKMTLREAQREISTDWTKVKTQ